MTENNGYVQKLKSLVVEQVDKFITKVLKDEYTVDNGTAPVGQRPGTGRIGQLMDISNPRLESPSTKDGTTKLYILPDDVSLTHPNNNPVYSSNLIHRLNTPFDHMERILLQDLSDVLDIEGNENYFRSIFDISFGDDIYNISGIEMSDDKVDYSPVNGQFNPDKNQNLFLDSFTYTPFIDYSQVDGEKGDNRIGIYSDQFLNDYNSGKYEDGSVPQFDGHRRSISSTLYRLGNLEKDLEDAKIAFRKAITYIDYEDDNKEKGRSIYIYTFCEHLAKLFAKLSNIRMCHEFYGFKAPHHEWEGILALDIWYQMLYLNIDKAYPFNDSYLNMNPMLRKKIQVDANNNKYIVLDSGGKLLLKNDGKVSSGEVELLNLEWMEDETDSEYAFVWDSSLWEKYNRNSEQIASKRKDCVTPRGVLKKIRNIVYSDLPSDITQKVEDDYPWFEQKGKVYVDPSMSKFTKYANLHLGRAYEVMSAKDYCELMNVSCAENYVKPDFVPTDQAQSRVLDKMLDSGVKALEDAFSVMRNEGLFNVFNSSTSQVEEFDENNADNYSQAQCAIAIERVFSRLYKYLQFKSTTGETFQRHINIDSGYKYLDSETIDHSDNPKSNVYYNDKAGSGMRHLGYLEKLKEYTGPDSNVLDDDEKDIVRQFNSILSKRASDWVSKHWSLCPLLIDWELGQQAQANEITNDETIDSPLYIDHYVPRNGESNQPLSASSGFKVEFRHLNSDGDWITNLITVDCNARVPFFIPDPIVVEIGDNQFRVFKFWKRVDGRITSSMTVLSHCRLEAVYDEISYPNLKKQEGIPSHESNFYPGFTKENGYSFSQESGSGCEYFVSGSEKSYCSLAGQNPKGSVMPDICRFVSFLNQLREGQDYDFNVLSLMEIDNVALLLKALFKINIDIAHKEYFLKIDIPEQTDYWYGYSEKYVEDNQTKTKWISFEPTVEYKFCNLHAANQVENGRLICTIKDEDYENATIVPVNRELAKDNGGIHYNDFLYLYDYSQALQNPPDGLTDKQRHYVVEPLHLHENTDLMSPVGDGFVKKTLKKIGRTEKQVRTFTSIVKKYRPIVMPNVRDIFNDCDMASPTKYDADKDNNYGVFGWCTIPSKTMVNMEYNEEAIIVPSSYDHHNRVGGSNFLQMDKDFSYIYQKWIGQYDEQQERNIGHLESDIQQSWYYLYNTRDWTYFLKPFFNVRQNSELYTFMKDNWGYSQNGEDLRPSSSDHINGVIFEYSNLGRGEDASFGNIVRTCQMLAKAHHNENTLNILAERWMEVLPFNRLKELTAEDDFNSVYGSQYSGLDASQDIPFDFPFYDWIDDYNKTGSYLGNDQKYSYNLGQAHAIDDFDEDSVWFYITMVEPIEDLNQVVEIEDIMPFVFWWDNRGEQNNGPTVDCYGLKGSAKLNYEEGGYCYSGAHEREDGVVEQKWHAVSHTLGVDFSEKENGGTILTTDNSGNVYKGAFDPNCAGTDEKWKVHHATNCFGANQHEDPIADKYYHGEKTHGEDEFQGKKAPDSLNNDILDSVDDRPMTWNLWNVVRHYAYIKWFKNRGRTIGTEQGDWAELENYTKKIVKSIYRTFQEKKGKNFNDVDEAITNDGRVCLVNWTNSFAQISSMLERNDRQHEASLVLFTGDIRKNDDTITTFEDLYKTIKYSDCNFRVVTLNGVDDDEDGIRPRKWSEESDKYVSDDENASDIDVFQGYKHEDMPPTYILGDSLVYKQTLPERTVDFRSTFDFDLEYPESEYRLNDTTRKWIRRIRQTIINKSVIPIYTSMETMDKDVHDLTMKDMKGITFQIVPQLYWRYEWSYNEFMIHRVGKLNPHNKDLRLYDMLGNVWELVRDNWQGNLRPDGYDPEAAPPVQNPIFCESSEKKWKVIKGGAFDQLIRKTISPSREQILPGSCKSQHSTQANVGFRPSLVFTTEDELGGYAPGDPIDLFFLFDASESQDNQLDKMLQAATDIVRQFAGDSSNKDACHVGSALFLGPCVRMMCCGERLKQFTQSQWWMTKTTKTYGGSWKCKHISDTYYFDFGSNWPLASSYSSLWDSKYHQPKEVTKMWGKKEMTKHIYKYGESNKNFKTAHLGTDGEWYVDPSYMKSPEWTNSSSIVDAKNSLVEQFRKYRDQVWMEEQTEEERRQMEIEDADRQSFIQAREIADELEYDPEVKQARLMAAKSASDSGVGTPILREGGSSGGHGGGGPGYGGGGKWYPNEERTTYKYRCGTKYFNVFCGVPAWYEGNDPETGTIHFGEIPEEDSTGDWEIYPSEVKRFKANYPFFTYDPTERGMDTFEYPFTKSDKGCLSTWWSSCEPICDILAKLLNEGVFMSHPWHDGIGYLFRKDVPKLVLVFTNEFDNSMTRTYSATGGTKEKEVVIVPGVDNKGKVKFSCETSWFGKHEWDPPDPYCVQTLKKGGLTSYLQSLKLDEQYLDVDLKTIVQDAKNSFSALSQQFPSIPTLKYKAIAAMNTSSADIDLSSSAVMNPTKFHKVDINNEDNPFKGMKIKDVLTDYQLNYYKQDNHRTFPDIDYNNKTADKVKYNAAQTVGFYQLRNATLKYPESVNVYLFVSDANAPRPLYEVDTSTWGETWTSDQAQKVADSLYLYNDEKLFKDIGKETWMKENAKYLSGLEIPSTSDGYYDKNNFKNTVAPAMEVIFGLQNPKETINMVFAKRDEWDSLNKQWKNFKSNGYDNESNEYTRGGEKIAKSDANQNGDTCKTTITHRFLLGTGFHSDFGLDDWGDWNKWWKYGAKKGNPVTRASVEESYIQENAFKPNETTLKGNVIFTRYIVKVLKYNIWEAYGETTPSNWVERIHLYSTTGKDGTTEHPNWTPLTESAKAWIDKHLCHRADWGRSARRKNHKMCQFNLDESNFQLLGIQLCEIHIKELQDGNWVEQSSTSNMGTMYFNAKITSICSAESLAVGHNKWRNDSYSWKNSPLDYVTITYRKQVEDPSTHEISLVPTGTLKILTRSEKLVDGTKKTAVGYDILLNQSAVIQVSGNEKVFKQIFEVTDHEQYPVPWKAALIHSASKRTKANSGDGWPSTAKSVNTFYDNMRKAMPLMMAYRYHFQIFSKLTNKSGSSVTDYADKKNFVVMKAIPIMEVSSLDDFFSITFDGTGQFNSGQKFHYSHCLVDLNPELLPEDERDLEHGKWYKNRQYEGLEPGKFPMKFMGNKDVNSDEYKTSKLVLTRIDPISGENADEFEMGSHASDYEEIDGEKYPLKIKYMDTESIKYGAEDDYIKVKLTNGGSYQKTDSLYEDIEDVETGEKKYFKNRHFFIAPFQLTIAQWCYVHDCNTKELAREKLGRNLNEIESSYWKYLSVWEKEEWGELKRTYVGESEPDEDIVTMVGDDEQEQGQEVVHPLENMEDEDCIDYLVNAGAYNPLEDTRPYYYATYNDVRGQDIPLYSITKRPQNISLEDWKWATYVLDSEKGDEYQMRENKGQSFLDLLNEKVAFKTTPRHYDMQEEGEYAVTLDQNSGKTWQFGMEGGINFDLPTEAQWEYCCRLGSTSAFPPSNDLGQNMDEQNESLDLIAWYKYKVIGSLPEPERFAAWRVSKFLFGISKDPEQVNNVYERV